MDPSPRKFPILNYVMTKIPSFKRRQLLELENDKLSLQAASALPETYSELSNRVSLLTDDDILASTRTAMIEVAQIRSVVKSLGERPDSEAVEVARSLLVEMESWENQLDEIAINERDVVEVDRRRKAAKREKQMYRALISLNEMHDTYGRLLVEAERKLQKLYEAAKASGILATGFEKKVSSMLPAIADDVKEEMADILENALVNGVARIDLSDRRLPFIPSAFGKLRTLVSLNLSSNKLMAIPDSVAGLVSLEELNISSNMFSSLPDSIGSLTNLKILNVSKNKLTSLPDAICNCRSLVEFDASFNQITYLPANIGYKLVSIRKFSMPLNKLCTLPPSIGEMKSLQFLDVHFNELKGLPLSIGKLTNLEVLNVGSNFNDLTCLPDTIGGLKNLKELDIGNNQIQQLPLTFGRISSLKKLVVDQNPLTVPPMEVVEQGVEAVKVYMSKRLHESIVEEEQRVRREREERAQAGWFTITTTWLIGFFTGPTVTDPFLNQRL